MIGGVVGVHAGEGAEASVFHFEGELEGAAPGEGSAEDFAGGFGGWARGGEEEGGGLEILGAGAEFGVEDFQTGGERFFAEGHFGFVLAGELGEGGLVCAGDDGGGGGEALKDDGRVFCVVDFAPLLEDVFVGVGAVNEGDEKRIGGVFEVDAGFRDIVIYFFLGVIVIGELSGRGTIGMDGEKGGLPDVRLSRRWGRRLRAAWACGEPRGRRRKEGDFGGLAEVFAGARRPFVIAPRRSRSSLPVVIRICWGLAASWAWRGAMNKRRAASGRIRRMFMMGSGRDVYIGSGYLT